MVNKKRLIDANALIDTVEGVNWYHIDKLGYLANGANSQYHTPIYKAEDIYNAIRNAPTVDAVEVVHGRWIHCQGKSNLWYCSECGEKILYNPTRRTYNIEKRPVHEVNKHCRNCGAKMDGGNEDG